MSPAFQSASYRLLPAVIFGLVGCQSPGPVVPGTNPDLEAEANRPRSVMAAGSLESAFGDSTTVGFTRAFNSAFPGDEVTAASERSERDQLREFIAESLATKFTEAGYEWVEAGQPQRTIEFAWFLSESDGLLELDELSRIAPGIPTVESLQRGMLVLAVSWPGRAAPLCRISIDGVSPLDWSLDAKRAAIPDSLDRLLAGLPRGPVRLVPEPDVEPDPEAN